MHPVRSGKVGLFPGRLQEGRWLKCRAGDPSAPRSRRGSEQHRCLPTSPPRSLRQRFTFPHPSLQTTDLSEECTSAATAGRSPTLARPHPRGFSHLLHPSWLLPKDRERARLSPDSPSLTPLAAGLGRGRDAPRHLAFCWMYPGRIRHGEKGGQSAAKLRDQFASQRPHLVCKHSAGAAASLLLLPPQQCFAPAVKAGSACFSLWSGRKLSQVRREQWEHWVREPCELLGVQREREQNTPADPKVLL